MCVCRAVTIVSTPGEFDFVLEELVMAKMSLSSVQRKRDILWQDMQVSSIQQHRITGRSDRQPLAPTVTAHIESYKYREPYSDQMAHQYLGAGDDRSDREAGLAESVARRTSTRLQTTSSAVVNVYWLRL